MITINGFVANRQEANIFNRHNSVSESKKNEGTKSTNFVISFVNVKRCFICSACSVSYNCAVRVPTLHFIIICGGVVADMIFFAIKCKLNDSMKRLTKTTHTNNPNNNNLNDPFKKEKSSSFAYWIKSEPNWKIWKWKAGGHKQKKMIFHEHHFVVLIVFRSILNAI